MFINHSCDANCETSEEDDHVWVTAIKNIAAGEEITYDYCLYDGDEATKPAATAAQRSAAEPCTPGKSSAAARPPPKELSKRPPKTHRREKAKWRAAPSALDFKDD